MATVTQIASGRWVADAATVWDTGAVPAIGDTVESTGAFDLAVDDDTNAVALFYMTSGSLTVDATKTLTTQASVTLRGSTGGTGTIACGGDFDLGFNHIFTGNVSIEMTGTGDYTDESSSPGGANLEINTAGTITLATDAYCVDFTMSAGTLVSTGYRVIATGDILYVGSTATTDLTIESAGGTLGSETLFNWNAGSGSRPILVVITGCVEVTTSLKTLAISGAGDMILPDAPDELVMIPAANGWWSFTGAITGDGYVSIASDYSPGGDINIEVGVVLSSSQSRTTVFDGDLSCASLWLKRILYYATMAAGKRLTVSGELLLGSNLAVAESGILTINGMASVGSLKDGNAANTANAFIFGPGSHLECSGLADFANITVTASTNMPPEIVCGAGGKVTNCEPDNEVALFGDADVNDTPGTNTVNITNFVNNQSYPGSLMTMGIGGGRLLVPFLLMGMGICSMMMKGMC